MFPHQGLPLPIEDHPYGTDNNWRKMERCVFYALGLIDSEDVISGRPLEDLVMRMPYPDNGDESEDPGPLNLIQQQPVTRPPLNVKLPTKDDIGRAWNHLQQGVPRSFGRYQAPSGLHFVPRVSIPLG